MNFGIPIALALMLFTVSGSLILPMENDPASQSPYIFPCKNQKIAREYDAFVTQLDLSLNPTTSVTKPTPKNFHEKIRKSTTWNWRMYVPKAKKSESSAEHCKKAECASALLAIKECTCHQKVDDKSSPN